MARSNVPKFGNWENEGDVPYTVYFDAARKRKGDKFINPNDPIENPKTFPAKTDEPIKRAPVRPMTPEHRERVQRPVRSFGNQVRSKLRPARGDESPERSPTAVPKFGAWKDSDPQSAENFTHIFNTVRNERNTRGVVNLPATPKHPSQTAGSRHSDEPKKCCLPWW